MFAVYQLISTSKYLHGNNIIKSKNNYNCDCQQQQQRVQQHQQQVQEETQVIVPKRRSGCWYNWNHYYY